MKNITLTFAFFWGVSSLCMAQGKPSDKKTIPLSQAASLKNPSNVQRENSFAKPSGATEKASLNGTSKTETNNKNTEPKKVPPATPLRKEDSTGQSRN